MIDKEIYMLELTKKELLYLYQCLGYDVKKMEEITDSYNNDIELMKEKMTFKEYTDFLTIYNVNEAIVKKIHHVTSYKVKK